jgi:hypothetical protein
LPHPRLLLLFPRPRLLPMLRPRLRMLLPRHPRLSLMRPRLMLLCLLLLRERISE